MVIYYDMQFLKLHITVVYIVDIAKISTCYNLKDNIKNLQYYRYIYYCVCGMENKNMSDINERICIAGAGPAGLTAAMYLEKKGYKNITVYEKSDRVGGKCYSPEYKGKRYEMGAMMGCPTYYTIKEGMDYIGMGHPAGPALDREFRDEKTGEVFNPVGKLESLSVLKQTKKFYKLLDKKYPGAAKNGHKGTSTELGEDFASLCDRFKTPKIKKLIINPYTSFGYGYMDEVPAAYVVKYLDKDTLTKFVTKDDLWCWKNGTQHIWELLSEKLNSNIKLNSEIKQVVRADGTVKVTTADGTEEYDKIIVTAPLEFMPEYFDATDKEKEYFSKIISNDYKVFVFTVKKYPKISAYLQGNMCRERAGHMMVYYHRWPGEEDQVITAYVLGDPERGITVDDCRKHVYEDMKMCGYEVDKMVNEQSWYYLPHLKPEDYKSGWYDEVESWQGKNNTYYAGEVMSFGDMEETAEYSKNLIERFF